MSTEDAPKATPAMKSSSSMVVVLECGCGCGKWDKVPAWEDKTQPEGKRLRPVQSYPYIALDCWRAGWRSRGPRDDGRTWDIYKGDDGRQVFV